VEKLHAKKEKSSIKTLTARQKESNSWNFDILGYSARRPWRKDQNIMSCNICKVLPFSLSFLFRFSIYF
jgi:hypothetical protein